MKEISQILSSLGYSKLALIVILLSVFIDITPAIKWNPIKSIFKYLGTAFNQSIHDELAEFKKNTSDKIEDIKQEQFNQREAIGKLILDNQNKEVDRLRWEVIDFDSGIKNGVKHSREEYRHVLTAFEKYLKIMKELDYSDGSYYNEMVEAGTRVKDRYEKYKDSDSLYF